LWSRLTTAGAIHLPIRIRDLIAKQEEASERLISWAQLLLLVTFTMLYLLTPEPTDAQSHMLRPVPYALLAYGAFTLLRLLASYQGFLSAPVIMASIVADTTLLLGLMWSFHFQYGQPASFSLKAPAFVYIFVFIALRALRFDPRLVLAAGLTAAIGWGFLLTLTLREATAGDITHSFVVYLTSNHILLGAEFDKIFAVLAVTSILTFAVWRARRTLITAVREETAKRDIGRFLSMGVAETIASSEEALSAGTAAERNAAIVMLDIRGFTGFSTEVPAQEVVAMLTSFHDRAIPVVTEHGGVIDKFLGDGIMATFGAVQSSKTAAADALRALEAVLAEASRWTDEQRLNGSGRLLEVNGAAAAGTVVFAVLGSGDRLEYTVIGEAANLAAKLEKHNKVEKSRGLTTSATLALARGQGYEPQSNPEARRSCRVAGVNEPLDLAAWA
jgi:adenylate cyclase